MVPQALLRPRKARILVVEDEVLIRALIAEELRLAGFSVIEPTAPRTRSPTSDQARTLIWYSRISGRPARSTDCNWLKRSAVNIPTCRLFSRQEMSSQSTSECFGRLFPSHTTSRRQSHSYQRSWLKSLPVNPISDPCILIVEEDLLVRTPLAEYLRECGYLVLEASSAGEARTLLEDGSRRVDIVLAEVKSGEPSGFASQVGCGRICPTPRLFWPEQPRQRPKRLATSAKRDPLSPSLMTTDSCWIISNVSSPQGTGTIARDAGSESCSDVIIRDASGR